MARSPKFDKYVNDSIVRQNNFVPKSQAGVVLSYNPSKHSATVMLTGPTGQEIGMILKHVPCPVQLGVQGVAPEPGRPCWVDFQGQDDSMPIITHYYNPRYEQFDHQRQNLSKNGIPRFTLVI